jgi:DNA repair exonuclease SbcCD ATPase subunit
MRARWILLAVAAGLLAGAAAVYVGLYRAADRRATEVRERAERDGEQHREALADYQRLLEEARGRAGELEELVEREREAGRAAADRARRAAERAGELGQNRSGRLQQRVSALLALQGQLKTRLAELSKTYSASEDSWRRALQAAEARERVRRIQGTIWAVVAALAGAGIGYGLARLAGP